MEKQEEKICPRCQRPFMCRMGDITRCQCSGVLLNDETRQLLENSFSGCLCLSCLTELSQASKKST